MSGSDININNETATKIYDSKNRVLCWFYVYKTELEKTIICGIIIIKQTNNNEKIFFYIETKILASDNDTKYENDDLIKTFINTKANNKDEAINEFSKADLRNKYYIDNYDKLSVFLKSLMT